MKRKLIRKFEIYGIWLRGEIIKLSILNKRQFKGWVYVLHPVLHGLGGVEHSANYFAL
jgi:hypothetical protein